MKKLLVFVLSLCPLGLFAQGGSDALPFVRTDFGPVLTGTAGAAVASTDAGDWSAFRNAAALSFREDTFGASGEFRFNGLGNIGGSGAMTVNIFDNLGIGLGLAYLGGDVIGGYRTADILLSSGMAFSLSEKLSVGMNVRYAEQRLTENIAYKGYNVDISVMAKVSDALSATAGLSTLGNKVESASGAEYKQPANLYAGAELSMEFDDNTLSLDAMGEYYFTGNFGASVGATILYDDKFSVRAGYRLASGLCVLPSHFALGIGTKMNGFSFNATFAKMPSTYVASIGIGFSY